MERLVYLSLGSNIGDRINHLNIAFTKIKERCGEITNQSALYETEPIGFDTDDNFINVCIEIRTELDPFQLLSETQEIEKESGRVKSINSEYSSRSLDIDLILFDNVIIEEKALHIPHPRFQDRKFVLQPLNDIASSIVDPRSNQTVNHLLNICIDDSLVSKIKNQNY